MKTSNLMHVTKCCKCKKEAITTRPCPGDAPKGYCLDHLNEQHAIEASAREADRLMDAVFASLGYNG